MFVQKNRHCACFVLMFFLLQVLWFYSHHLYTYLVKVCLGVGQSYIRMGNLGPSSSLCCQVVAVLSGYHCENLRQFVVYIFFARFPDWFRVRPQTCSPISPLYPAFFILRCRPTISRPRAGGNFGLIPTIRTRTHSGPSASSPICAEPSTPVSTEVFFVVLSIPSFFFVDANEDLIF